MIGRVNDLVYQHEQEVINLRRDFHMCPEVGFDEYRTWTNYPHHRPKFNIDENSLAMGVEMHVKTALRYLSDQDEIVFGEQGGRPYASSF